MTLAKQLYSTFLKAASETTVELVSVGLGYTAVITADGGIGLAYTQLGQKGGCSVIAMNDDFEGRPATLLLDHILSPRPIYRSMALALINALNHNHALSLPEDRSNRILFDSLNIVKGTHVAMVGYFGPLLPKLDDIGAIVEIVDINRNMGEHEKFMNILQTWADAVIITSTSILNDTFDAIFENVRHSARIAMLGPSTPMSAEPFRASPVQILAGTVPVEREPILKAVRNGHGTPALQKFSRKAYLICSTDG